MAAYIKWGTLPVSNRNEGVGMSNDWYGWLQAIKAGDTITRDLAGVLMKLRVSAITGDRIVCGPWEFSRRNGAEIDEELGWDERRTGSILVGCSSTETKEV